MKKISGICFFYTIALFVCYAFFEIRLPVENYCYTIIIERVLGILSLSLLITLIFLFYAYLSFKVYFKTKFETLSEYITIEAYTNIPFVLLAIPVFHTLNGLIITILVAIGIKIVFYFFLDIITNFFNNRIKPIATFFKLRRNLSALLIFFIVTCLFFPKVFTEGKTINSNGFLFLWKPFSEYKPAAEKIDANVILSDHSDFYYPLYYSLHNSIMENCEIPILNKNYFGVSIQSTTLIYPSFSLEGVFSIIFGPAWGITFLIFLRVTLGAFFTYLFLRLHSLEYTSSLFGGLVFAFSTVMMILLIRTTFAFLPILFYLSELIIQKRRLKHSIFLIVTYIFLLYSGMISWIAYVIFFHMAYVFSRMFSKELSFKDRKIIFSIFIFSGISSLILLAFAILPSIEHYSFLDLSYRVSNSKKFLPLFSLISFIFPKILGPISKPFLVLGNVYESIMYVGFIPLILFFISFFYKKNKTVYFFIISIVLTILIITNTGPFLDLFRKIPFFHNSANTRMRFLFGFFFAVTSAFGISKLSEINLHKISTIIIISTSAVIVFFLAVIIIPTIGNAVRQIDITKPFVAKHLISQLLMIAFSMIIITGLFLIKKKRVLFGLLIFILLYNFFNVVNEYIPYLNDNLSFPKTKITDFLKKNTDKGGRILPLERTFISLFGLVYDIPSIQPRGHFNQSIKDFYQNIDPKAFEGHQTMYYFDKDYTRIFGEAIDICNVKYLLADKRFNLLSPTSIQLVNLNAYNTKIKVDKENELIQSFKFLFRPDYFESNFIDNIKLLFYLSDYKNIKDNLSITIYKNSIKDENKIFSTKISEDNIDEKILNISFDDISFNFDINYFIKFSIEETQSSNSYVTFCAIKNSDLYKHGAIIHPDNKNIQYNDLKFNISTLPTKKYLSSLKKWKLIYDDELEVYENQNYLKRAFITPYDVYSNQIEEFEVIDKKHNLRNTAIISSKDKLLNNHIMDKQLIQNVDINYIHHNEVSIITESNSDGHLVFSQFYQPGWKAYLDETEVEIYKADYVFMAIKLPAGKHQIKFVFFPKSLKYGLMISFSYLVFLITIYLFCYRKKKSFF